MRDILPGSGSKPVRCLAGTAERIADSEHSAPGALSDQGDAGQCSLQIPQQEGALLQDQSAAAQSD